MNGRLYPREQLEAGKLAGNILVSDYHAREKLLEEVPSHLIKYVKEVIADHDNIEISRLSEEIAKLPTRSQRNDALQNIHFYIRRSVKERVIEFFERGRSNGVD